MKNITAASFLAISSVMFGAKAFPQPAGTVVDYNFKNDRFGTNDRLKLGLVSPHIRSPRRGIYERDPGHWSLYMRDADAGITHERNAYPDAYPGKPSTIGGGNQVQNTYDLKNDKIGNNNNLYMQASTGVKGGNTAAAVSTSGGKNGKDKRGLYESSGLKDRKLNDVLYERDAYADIEAHYNKREALPHVVSTGCNTFLNNPTLKEYKSGNGQTVSMQSSSRQFGGNTIRGRGDSNYAKRWLQARDLEIAARSAELESLIFEREALGNGGAAKGGDNKPQAGNIVSNKPSSKGQGPVNQSAQMSQSGGNNFGGKGGANTGNGGQGSFGFSPQFSPTLSIPALPRRRWIKERNAEPEF